MGYVQLNDIYLNMFTMLTGRSVPKAEVVTAVSLSQWGTGQSLSESNNNCPHLAPSSRSSFMAIKSRTCR